ncbi:MAG: ATP-binding cassette domain-containing protein [Spirochaetes bacterium]|nr:ATP-binding cassette domain-containing protein [Spirochaetota bacterium]
MNAETPLISVRNLKKYYPVFSKGFIRKEIASVRAVDDVSFDVKRGETLGLVGESGCGKTTTARSILRALTPTAGEVIFNGKNGVTDLAALTDAELKPLRVEMQMIFQDPFSSLNPRMTVGTLVAEPMVIHRMGTPAERSERVAAMLVKVGLKPEHMTRYPHAFSGGQRQRIGIARALIMHPSFVIADEAVSALDVSVQAQVINLLADLQEEMGLTYIFVAHDLSVVRYICDRVAVMYAGKIVELGPVEEIFNRPRHPYTKTLIGSVPNPDPDMHIAVPPRGEAADVANLPSGCSFHPRCAECDARCKNEAPKLQEYDSGIFVSCHHPGV